MGTFFKHGLAGALIGAALLPIQPAHANPNKEAEDRFIHHTIVQYVAIRTYLPERLCADASPSVRADVTEIVVRFRSRFPELVRLAESSPLFDDANQPNMQTLNDFASRSLQEHDEACTQLRNEIAVDINGEQVYFDKWTRELQRHLQQR
ncbi:hypothetical protein EGT07_01310 [Herbaspirillum sp. HC18]|nr:hypothetical protein EGT07_01310 [Herbaspirillum sp. HC18]